MAGAFSEVLADVVAADEVRRPGAGPVQGLATTPDAPPAFRPVSTEFIALRLDFWFSPVQIRWLGALHRALTPAIRIVFEGEN